MKRVVLLVVLLAFGSAEGRALLYPTAARLKPNLYDESVWFLASQEQRARDAPDVVFSETKGGPFSSDDHVWCVRSDKPQPGYWHAYVKAKKHRTYLVGTWARFANAKILLWYNGNAAADKKFIGNRLYYMSGFNMMLKPYFCDELLKRLSGDPAKWHCLYRLIEFPVELHRDVVNVGQGLYLAAGDVAFSEPFFVDVTDGPRTLEVDVSGEKPFVALAVTETDTRDVRWEKKFNPPVTSFRCTLPQEIDAFRGQKADYPKGHTLTVRYADGSVETVSAPLENVFKERI